jgi:hypothetical protein
MATPAPPFPRSPSLASSPYHSRSNSGSGSGSGGDGGDGDGDGGWMDVSLPLRDWEVLPPQPPQPQQQQQGGDAG